MRSRLLALLAVLPLAAVSLANAESPACYTVDDGGTPDDTSDDVEACELETWFHRADTPAGNVEALGAEAYPTFDTNPPAGSVTEGNGGGYLGSSIVNIAEPGSPASGVRFVGEFDGVIDRMDVTLHLFYNGFGGTAGPSERRPHSIDLYLSIDGFQVLTASKDAVTTSDFDDPTAGPHQLDFTIIDLAGLIDAYGLDVDATHSVELTIVPKYINTNPVAMYVYDTTEVPGGIFFNPVEIDESATVIDAF